MSKWGLAYKGVEILTPTEWNLLIDALNELDARLKYGTAKFNGDGSTKEFRIPHELEQAPLYATVIAGSADASSRFYLSWDDTDVVVTYIEAPPVGEENVVLHWLAIRKAPEE